MQTPRKRKVLVLYLVAGVAALLTAGFLFAPNQIASAKPITCVDEYLPGKYLITESCDSVFADYAVIVSRNVRESWKDEPGWTEQYCGENVDGKSTYALFEVDGEEYIACLGTANH